MGLIQFFFNSRMEPVVVSPLIYCLELEQGKYYVGITYNLNFRYAQHKSGEGARWTKLYKPLRIMEVISEDVDRNMEDTITLQYIERYGAENVRGGSYCKIRLDVGSHSSVVSTP